MARYPVFWRRRLMNLSFPMMLLFLLALLFLPFLPSPLDLKTTPTDFWISTKQPNWSSPRILPEDLLRSWTGPSRLDIDAQYMFIRELGSGREGTVRLYSDTRSGRAVAIKTFHSERRNRLPGPLLEAIQPEILTDWPTEIPATLFFSNLRLETHDEKLFSKHQHSGQRLDTIPALDYFLVHDQESRWSPPKWQLVTPYLEGTLSDFAERLKKKRKTYQELDTAFRPGLYRLLQSLARMHSRTLVRPVLKPSFQRAKFQCHNDIKPDNIFVSPGNNWLIGDLVSEPVTSSCYTLFSNILGQCQGGKPSVLLQQTVGFGRTMVRLRPQRRPPRNHHLSYDNPTCFCEYRDFRQPILLY